MHVALLGDFPEDLEHPRGGVESVAACLAAGLVRSGVELSIVRYGAAASGDTRHPQLGCRMIGLPRIRPAGLTFSTITPFAVDRVLDMCRTTVNVWSDSCGCAVVDRFAQDSEEVESLLEKTG